MKTRTREVRTYEVSAICDKCGGDLIRTGESFTNGLGTTYTHICNDCHVEVDLPKHYPHILYEHLDNPIQDEI